MFFNILHIISADNLLNTFNKDKSKNVCLV